MRDCTHWPPWHGLVCKVIRVRHIGTGELLETGRTHALTPFASLAPDFQVWCARDGESRPVIIRRCELEEVSA